MCDFQYIEANVLNTYKGLMELTPQPKHWHDEGDVYTHTLMAVDALHQLPEYQSLNSLQKHILTIATLLHDIGKVKTTQSVMGEVTSPHHAPTGSRMARELLWKQYGMCGNRQLMQAREAICQLIRYHSFPPHAIDMKNGKLQLHKIASNSLLAPDFSISMLCMLCKADMLGRKCNDQKLMLDQIALCEELAQEEGCLNGCYPFPSDATRRTFLSGQEVWKEQSLFDDTWGEVIMMSGLPGTGKDTWIAKNLPHLPVVSLDDLRRKHKISPNAEQGYVANMAREQAKEYLRKHQPFVWNATSITPQLRESLISLFETYHARVRIVYLETDFETELQRNAQRSSAVPLYVIESMLSKLTPPEPHEARTVDWVSV
ncbi:MAG: AAA family ATPase [Muribaculaceae bacterium]